MDTNTHTATSSSTPASRPPDDVTCTFCNGPYSDSRPAVLVPDTATVYGHQACINSSTIGMKAIRAEQIQPPRTIEEMLTKAIAHLDAWLDADERQPRLISDLHSCMDEMVSARAELRRLKTEVLSA